MTIKKMAVCACMILLIAACRPQESQDNKGTLSPPAPLEMSSLKEALSYARGVVQDNEWPRTIKYSYEMYDFKTDTFSLEDKTFNMKRKPLRIVPHAVGVADILWAICPRERILSFNEYSADPDFSFISDEVRKSGNIFRSKQTELIIGLNPDIVFTVFYSDSSFKDKLKQANVPFFDLGYFGTISSIESQILLLGRIIGEEGNAEALIKTMNEKIADLKTKLPQMKSRLRVLYYDEGGYIPGKSSNFTSICELINVINVGEEKGIKSWSQIDFETLLKWDPDIIIVPEGSRLKEQLTANKILSHAKAVKENKIYYVPGVYLRVDSQFIILSANLLAGIVYER